MCSRFAAVSSAVMCSLLAARETSANSMAPDSRPHAAKLFDVKGRVAIVTGSTQGLGKAMASALYCSGATVIINGRDHKKTCAAAATIEEEAASMGLNPDELGKCVPIAGDVSIAQNANLLVAETVQRCGKIDIVSSVCSCNLLIPSRCGPRRISNALLAC